MSRKKIELRPILLEAFFVVLGVVLALAANEWRQSRAEGQRTELAIEALKEEIALNQQMLRESVDYHLAISDSLRQHGMRARNTGVDAPPPISVFSKGFIHPTDLVTTSWSLAISTDALSNMPFYQALAFSRIYALYDAYEKQKESVADLFYVDLYQGGYQKVLANYQNLSIIVGTFSYTECELMETVRSSTNEVAGLTLDDLPSAPEFCARMLRR